MFYYFVIFLSILLFLLLNLFLFSILFFLLIIIIILIYFILFQKKCYNSITQENLAKYGNYKIINAYLIKKNITKIKFIFSILNFLSFYQYNSNFIDVIKLMPYHLKLLVEIKINKKTKFLIIEKNTEILIHEKVAFDKNFITNKIPIIKNKYTINDILNYVQLQMKNNYFNWHFVTNNCQKFIKEIIYFIHKKNKIYHFQENKFNKYKNYIFVYIVNFVMIILADLGIFTEKYFSTNILSLFI